MHLSVPNTERESNSGGWARLSKHMMSSVLRQNDRGLPAKNVQQHDNLTLFNQTMLPVAVN